MKNQDGLFIVLYYSLFLFIVLVSLLLTWDMLAHILTLSISCINRQVNTIVE